MVSKIKIHVEGHGTVVVKIPKNFNKKTYADGLGEAVAKTMQLTFPVTKEKRFHPVLGYKHDR